MAEVPVVAGLPKPLTVVVTVAAVAAVVGVAYRLDRTYARWLTDTSPFIKPRARLDQLRTGYRTRHADMSDLAHVIFDVLDEIDLVRSLRSTR
jgi:hypothetical protein